MPRYCAFPGCQSRTVDVNKNYGLHKFPSDKEICQKWVAFVQQFDPAFAGLRLNNERLCSYHFTAKCFKPYSRIPGDGRTEEDGERFQLNSFAVPTETTVNTDGVKRKWKRKQPEEDPVSDTVHVVIMSESPANEEALARGSEPLQSVSKIAFETKPVLPTPDDRTEVVLPVSEIKTEPSDSPDDVPAAKRIKTESTSPEDRSQENGIKLEPSSPDSYREYFSSDCNMILEMQEENGVKSEPGDDDNSPNSDDDYSDDEERVKQLLKMQEKLRMDLNQLTKLTLRHLSSVKRKKERTQRKKSREINPS